MLVIGVRRLPFEVIVPDPAGRRRDELEDP